MSRSKKSTKGSTPNQEHILEFDASIFVQPLELDKTNRGVQVDTEKLVHFFTENVLDKQYVLVDAANQLFNVNNNYLNRKQKNGEIKKISVLNWKLQRILKKQLPDTTISHKTTNGKWCVSLISKKK